MFFDAAFCPLFGSLLAFYQVMCQWRTQHFAVREEVKLVGWESHSVSAETN